MTRARALIGLAICVAIAVAIGGYALYNATRVTPESDPVGYVIKQSRPLLDAVRMAPLVAGSLPDEEDRALLATRIAGAEVAGAELLPQGDRDAMLEDLRGQVADLLYFRFAVEDPEGYIGWRRSHGQRFLTPEEFPKTPGASLDSAYKFWFGKQAPAGATPESVFRELFRVSLESHGGSNQVVSVPEPGPGLLIGIGERRTVEPLGAFALDGQLGSSAWYGSIASTCGRWMTPPEPLKNLLDRYETVLYAEVGLVLGYKSGPRRPMILHFFWDPERKTWQFDFASVHNYRPPAGVNPCPVM